MPELQWGRLLVPAVIWIGSTMVILGEGLALAATVAVGAIVLVALRPAAGAYMYLAVTPLVAGISRDVFLPVVRIHEALLGIIVVGLLARGLVRMVNGHQYRLRHSKVDVAIVAMAVTGSLVSLLWRYAQGAPLTSDDFLHATVFWKYLLLYLVFRMAIRTTAQARVSLWISLGVTAIVAVVGVLQALGLFGVPEFLFKWYPAFLGEQATVGRGASTLSLTFAVADVSLICAAAAAALLRHVSAREKRLLVGLIGVYVLGAIGAGQFSGYIGMVVALVALGVALGELRNVIRYGALATVLGGVLAWPVINNRVSGFQNTTGVPQSWSGRLDNLTDFILPEFANGWNILFGVRPAARVPAPETWRDWVFIESGYLWLLWSGGIPLLIAFTYFAVTTIKMLMATIRAYTGELQAIAVGAFVGLWVIVVVSLLDPHLTMRGVADLLFPLIAMAQLGQHVARKQPTRDIEEMVSA